MDSIQMIYFLPLVFLLLSISQANAAIVLTPTTPGLATNAATGNYLNNQAGSLQKMFDSASRTYGPGTSTAQVGGRTASIATKIPLSTTAGTVVKNALKLNPLKIAGTLAAGWLIEKGLQWQADTNQWVKSGSTPGTFYSPCPYQTGVSCYEQGVLPAPYNGIASGQKAQCEADGGTLGAYETGGTWYAYCGLPLAWVPTPVPMTDADWDALSDPIPTVGGELPNVPYMPDGAPVGTPQFSPGDISIGAPYTKADGSTAEPRAKITDNNDGTVTLDTYEKNLTNPDGTPAPADAPISDTPEPPPPEDPCIKNPDRIGCMNAGTDEFAVPKKTIDFSFSPEASPIGAGSCPAPIYVLGHSISYQPACDAMGMIRALIIGMASMTAAFILVGGFKSE